MSFFGNFYFFFIIARMFSGNRLDRFISEIDDQLMSKKIFVLINLATIGLIDCHRLSSIAIEFFWKAKTKCSYRRNTLKFNS